MDKLGDKRVGIIGTGATAVQCIPQLARAARELFVFQRTPSSIDVRNNHPIEPEFFSTLEAGWQEKWLMNFATLQAGGFADEDLVKDGWTDISQRIRDRIVAGLGATDVPFGPEEFRRAYEESDDEKMAEIRARVDAIVADPQTAQGLKPWYRQLCKRPCFHDEYLQAFNEPGVQLVDSEGRGVEAIDESGVWVGGAHYELDCLIFASGFEVGTDYARRSGFQAAGRGGLLLSEHWAEGMRSMHGLHVHGFPNLFIVGPNQNASLISNITHNLTEAGTTIATVVAHALEVGADEVEVSEVSRGGLGTDGRGQRPVVPGRPGLHSWVLQQRGPAHGPARAAQHRSLPRRAGRLLPLHRRVAHLGRLRGTRVPHQWARLLVAVDDRRNRRVAR